MPISEPSVNERAAVGREVRVKLLGGFELSVGDQTISLPFASQRIVALLALHRKPLQRPYVAGMLWFDASDERAHARLRSALWRLSCCCRPVVSATRTHVALAPGVLVDVHEQMALARRVLDAPAESVPLDCRLTLEGDLLPDWYDEWISLEREYLRQLRVHALEGLAERLGASGRYAEAAAAVLSTLRADPLRESAHRLLIRIYLMEGNRADAVRQYGAYCGLLKRKLGLDPPQDLHHLLASVMAGEAHEDRTGDDEVMRR